MTWTAIELAGAVRSALNCTAATSLPPTGHPQCISQWLIAAGVIAGALICHTEPERIVADTCALRAQSEAPYG